MSLDVILTNEGGVDVYYSNITHNLNNMAMEAGIYQHLWRPDEIGIELASELIDPLLSGLIDMIKRPFHYKQFNSPNGWGLYDNFIPWVTNYVHACMEYPEAKVSVSR